MKYVTLKTAIDFLDTGEAPEVDAGLFGVRIDPIESELILIPVAWDGTASYGKGTAFGPQRIIQASHQLDMVDSAFGKPYRLGISYLEDFKYFSPIDYSKFSKAEIQKHGEEINQAVFEESKKWIDLGKTIGVVGGEHSVPLGAIKAIDQSCEAFGIVHIDAHHDLRDAYEGYPDSHASIMRNAKEQCKNLTELVSVGIRDYSADESSYAEKTGIRTYYNDDIHRRLFSGDTWANICLEIISRLPNQVYISFDIDGLLPELCPNTGTPVPGGLSFNQATYLIEKIVESGRNIIGFDLCEVSPNLSDTADEWDANVGARVLYKLCGGALSSEGVTE